MNNITFENNAYLACIKEEYKTKKDIGKYAKTHLQFQYGHVSFEDFRKKYQENPSTCFEKTIRALPNALWTITIDAIHQLATTVIEGIFDPQITNLDNYLQAKSFTLARTLEKSLGWIISLFHEQLGQYHIQQSQFHKTCYDYHIEHMTDRDIPSPKIPKKTQTRPTPPMDQEDSLNNRYLEIQKISNISEKDLALASLAQTYLEQQQTIHAQNIVSTIVLNIKIKDKLYGQIATQYLQKKNVAAALMINQFIVQDLRLREQIATAIVNTALETYDPQQAQTASYLLFTNTPLKDECLKKIAVHYIQNTQITQALDIARNLVLDYRTQDAIRIHAVEKCIQLQKYDTAVEIGSQLFNKEYRQTWMMHLAKIYYQQGNKVNTKQILINMISEEEQQPIHIFFGNQQKNDTELKNRVEIYYRRLQDHFLTYSAQQLRNKLLEVLSLRFEYVALNLNRTAQEKDIKRAYRELTKLYHPDRVEQQNTENDQAFLNRREECRQLFNIITRAYETLMQSCNNN